MHPDRGSLAQQPKVAERMPDLGAMPDLSFEQFAAAFAKALDEQNGGRIGNLSRASRVCHEGGIAGDDFPELLERIAAVYGTDFSGIPPFGGPEFGVTPVGVLIALWKIWRGKGDGEEEPDVTVGELYEAVKAGSWNGAFPNKSDGNG